MTQRNDAAQAGLIKDVANDNVYSYVSGVMIMPVAVATPVIPAVGQPLPDTVLPVVVRLHQPYTIRKQSWSLKKDQNPGPVPAPEKDVTLISSTVSVPLPKLGTTSVPSFNWEIAGQYTYLSPSVYTEKTGYPSGRYPTVFPQIEEMKKKALPGGDTISNKDLGVTKVNIEEGGYFWPYYQMFPAAFFDPELSKTV